MPAYGVGRSLLLLVGPSGCGKSSLVQAGLLPTMAGEADWLTLPPMRPGREPTAALARGLANTARDLGSAGRSPTSAAGLMRRAGRAG